MSGRCSSACASLCSLGGGNAAVRPAVDGKVAGALGYHGSYNKGRPNGSTRCRRWRSTLCKMTDGETDGAFDRRFIFGSESQKGLMRFSIRAAWPSPMSRWCRCALAAKTVNELYEPGAGSVSPTLTR